MAILGKLKAEPRTKRGSKESDRLRDRGIVPGNMYGHKQDAVALQVTEEAITHLVRAGTRVLDVECGSEKTTALIREVQWDFLGNAIQHFDLQRVDPNEKLTVEVHVELKGTAPGVLGGGVLDHSLRTVTVECPVSQIPDNILVKIGALEIGQAIHIRELEVPPNTRILNNPEAIVVRIAKAMEVVLTAPAAGEEGAAQPEVIGRKAAEEEGEEAEK
jgi:large subunit ribosomal protein L25